MSILFTRLPFSENSITTSAPSKALMFRKRLHGVFGIVLLLCGFLPGYSQAPNINYSSPQVYSRGNTISSLSPTNTGGAATSYAVWPSLPAGLTLSSTTGVISGTPTVRSKQVYYKDDFNDGNGGVASIFGNATYSSGLLRLTDASSNQSGALSLPASTINSTSFQVDFTLVTAKTSGGADGLSYNFSGDGTPMDATLNAEYGTGTGLTLSFFTIDGSIRLFYGGGRTGGTTLGSGGLVGINTTSSTLWTGKTVPVSLYVDNDGKATVTVDGSTVINAVQLPSAYSSATKTTWTHIVRARTGAGNDVHALSDLVIRMADGAADHTVTASNGSGNSTAVLNITVADLPTVSSTALSNITASGALSGGNVTDDGGVAVSARGVVWSTSPNPTVLLSTKTENGTGTGSFSSAITGLLANTMYYSRAYATNAAGTGYGAESSFTTPDGTPSISFPSANYSFTLGTSVNPVTLVTSGGLAEAREVQTIAGSGFGHLDGTGTSAKFGGPSGIVVDGNGVIYVIDEPYHRIRKITTDNVVSTFAGDGSQGFLDGNGTATKFSKPTGLTLDAAGNLYVADQVNNRIRKITPAGVVSTFAGGSLGTADGTGTSASFNGPAGIVCDKNANVLYVTEINNNRIRKINLVNAAVTTFAGSVSGYVDGTGTAARFKSVAGIAVDGSGNLYVADAGNNRIRKITPAGVVTTLAGPQDNPLITSGYIDATGTAARFNTPQDVAVDANGNVFVLDMSNRRIRKVTSSGTVTTIAGSGISGTNDGTGTAATFNKPFRMAMDGYGNIFVSDQDGFKVRIISRYRISPALPAGLVFDSRTGTIRGTPTQVMAGRVFTVYTSNSLGEASASVTLEVVGTPTVTANISSLKSTTVGIAGTVNANGSATSSITFKFSTNKADVDAGGGITVPVSPSIASGFASTSIAVNLTGLSAETMYYGRLTATNTIGISSTETLILQTTPQSPVISYGVGTRAYTVNTAISSESITNTGGQPDIMQVSRFTRQNSSGYVNGPASLAKFFGPGSITIDGNGDIYVGEVFGQRVRKITQSGEVSLVAGSVSGTSGAADGVGANATFNEPSGLSVSNGKLYVCDQTNHRIREIDLATGTVTTKAGGTAAWLDGNGTAARFFYPKSIDQAGGQLYVADGMNQRIRKVDLATNAVSTIAGAGMSGAIDGSASSAAFNNPTGLVVDAAGDIYISEFNNHTIRKLNLTAGVVSTIAGKALEKATVDGFGNQARLSSPGAMALDSNGNLYVLEGSTQFSRIRKVVLSSNKVTTLAGGGGGGVDGSGTLAGFSSALGIAYWNNSLYIADRGTQGIRKISKFAISPALPAGLSFDANTGAITGTPTVITPLKTYTVTTANEGGMATATIDIEVTSTLLTSDVSAITETAANSGGTVDASFSNVTARGVVWSTTANPTTALSTKTSDGAGTGTFTSSITGLTANTTYYVRSYVVHSAGTDYGPQKNFKTNQLGTFADITKTYSDANFSLTAPTAVSTGAFSYTSSNTSVATISGSTVTITGVGTSTITATQGAAGAYASLMKTLTLTVNKTTPIIILNVPTTSTLAAANNMPITATASNGEAVTIAIGSGTATGTLTPVSAGSYTLSGVSQTGNLIFNATTAATATHAAGSKTVTMDVTKNNQSITFNPISAVSYSTGMTQTLTASTSATGLSVSYAVISGPGSISGNILNITGTGIILIKASQAGDAIYNAAPDVERTLVVNPGTPIVSSFAPASAREGDVVTITGQYFENVSAVSFGGTAATSFTVVNSNTITAVVGTGTTGSVAVTTTGGTHSKTGFRYKVLWTGATKAFNQSSNWSGSRVPQTDDDIVFDPNAASDLELDGSKTVGNVDFNGSGKALKLGTHNLIVKGNLSMPGNITGSGKVIMRGSSAQTIVGGGQIPYLEIDNAAGVSIDASGSEVEVTGVLRSTAGTLNANGKLRLTSNSSGTARVAPVTGSVTGNVIAERYVKQNQNTDGTGRAWRLVSVPVTGSGTLRDFFMNGRNGQDLTLQAVRDNESENSGSPIVGHNYVDATSATAAGFDWIGVANMVSSLRYYSGDAGGGAFNSDQVPSLSTTFTNANQGYMVFARGDRKLEFPSTNNASATTFRSTGTLKTGNQTISVAPASTSKYTLVGNPYMSVLDLDAFYTTNSAVINPSFWIWESNIAGSNKQGEFINIYKSGTEWVTNTGSYINPQLIESGVAFFVEPLSSLATATNINILETHKSTEVSAGLSPLSTEPKDERGRLFVKLQRADARGERQLIDGVAFEFHKDHKEILGDAIDHEKMRNGISRGSLWVTTAGKSLSSEGRPWPALDSRKSIPLQMSNIGDQTLIVSFDPRGMNKPGLKAWLKDNSLKTEKEIDLSRVNEFDFIGTGSAAKDSNRFEIVYTQTALPPVKFISTSAKKVATGVEVTWETTSDAGASYEILRSADLETIQTIHTRKADGKTQNNYSFIDTKPHPVVNYYRVVSKNATGQFWSSPWMRVNMSMQAGDWKLYPNPSKENKLNLELAEIAAGEYTVQLFDQQGRQLDKQPLKHSGGNGVYAIPVQKRLTPGIYILQVTNARGVVEQTMKWMRE